MLLINVVYKINSDISEPKYILFIQPTEGPRYSIYNNIKHRVQTVKYVK